MTFGLFTFLAILLATSRHQGTPVLHISEGWAASAATSVKRMHETAQLPPRWLQEWAIC